MAASTKKSTNGSSKSSARKRPPKPATREEEALSDARYVLARVTAYWTEFKKFDAHREVKLFPESAKKELAAQIRATSTAMGAHSLKSGINRGETPERRALRSKLVQQLREIRETVALAYPGADEKSVRAAFGVGQRLSTSSDADAIALATMQQQAYEDSEGTGIGGKARDAGITQAQIDAIVAARRALSDAGVSKATSSKQAAGLGSDKRTLVRDLKKLTTRARKVGALIFKKKPAIVKEFTLPARKPAAKRAKKAPGAGTGAATASA